MLTEIKRKIAESLSPILGLGPERVAELLELPKSLEHGHLALPVFFLAKEWRKAPPAIAQELATKAAALHLAGVCDVKPVGGYVNFHFETSYLQTALFEGLTAAADRLGHSDRGRGRRLVIDFSSPNVAKPMHVGHLRATVIGKAISNLAVTQGYTVIGLNHLGDWGVQFGKLAWAYLEWGSEYDFVKEPFESLYSLYVRFHEAAKDNPGLDSAGAAVFKRLEDGDPEIRRLWKMFVDISMKEYERMWSLLGVRHDLVRGESFYNDRLKPTERLLEEKGLLVQSEGAMVVPLDDLKMPPCLIRKSDGASLYATRDLASALYRHDDLKADLNLYVVGVDQSLHFNQVFAVLKKMGYSWADNCHHIAFGLYRFKDGKMSSRKGGTIRLEDVMERAIELVAKIIESKNPDLPNKETVARQVGVGAIVFNDLVNDRVKNVEFDWDRALDFEGDSGPYVQYCLVRCHSLIKKSGRPAPTSATAAMDSPEERELVRILLNYQDVLTLAFNGFKPHVLATYLLDVCRAFNHFYHKCRILGEAPETETSRLALVGATRRILEAGLKVLNIEAPEAM